MGCGNCGVSENGKPTGCKSNGGCSTGGCNRMNVYDWLNALPLYEGGRPYPIVEISFSKGSRKDFYKNGGTFIPEKGDWVVVEGVNGYDIGEVNVTGELVKLQMKKYGVGEHLVSKRILRLATADDLKHYKEQKLKEPDVLIRSRAIARTLNLEMKLCEVELQADGKKATFFYTADQRVDFRDLIKMYATDFRLKVEMKQIGARQESGKVGGIGSCGRELCCSTWLTDFKSVNTNAARYQNLSINQTKLSGQCGRLKCCLNYELDTYMDALRVFPDHAETIDTNKGPAVLQKKDIFKNLMWYSYSDSSKQYPLAIARVKEILALNKQGQKAEDLQPVELEIKTKSETGHVGFVNDVGQISLKTLEKGNKKRPAAQNLQNNRGQDKKAAGKTEISNGKQQDNRPKRTSERINPQESTEEKNAKQPTPENRDRQKLGNQRRRDKNGQNGQRQEPRKENDRKKAPDQPSTDESKP